MQNDPKAPATRRIDLSNCKLLSTYGRNLAEPSTNLQTKVGQVVKTGALIKQGILTKLGLINKIGVIIKPTSH